MKKNLLQSYLSFILSVLFCCLIVTGTSSARDLNASLAQLPDISESAEKGVFVDLIKALDSAYGDGQISIKVYPFARSIENVVQSKADFHIPLGRNPLIPEEKLPFRYVSEKVGDVVFVLYTRADNPITIDDIRKAKASGNFPYAFETYRGMENFFDFPAVGSSGIDQSFNKLLKKRLDGCLFAQEESDFVLKQLNLKGVHRAFFCTFDDVIIVPKTTAGDETEKILSQAIRTLRADGRLKALHLKIHQPYQDWQP